MLLDDIADYLSSGGCGTVGVDIFKSFLPDTMTDLLVIYETGGHAAVHAMSAVAGAAKAEMPRIQVVTRSGAEFDYSSARTLAHRAFKLLDQMPERNINGVRYMWGAAVQSPFILTRNENKRPLIACNYDIVKELSTTS